ncbi:hypothetical protein [Kitasatospora sp. MBT63]|uniref:hypothetical protein n=1 Tax=Kitasatospora sp. MBT63 TaxID=1444768 RepID=UPI0018F50879
MSMMTCSGSMSAARPGPQKSRAAVDVEAVDGVDPAVQVVGEVERTVGGRWR